MITLEYQTKAFELVEHYHKNQKRDDGRDYIVHIENVYHLLTMIGASVDTQVAGILHDILEDTICDETEIENKFNTNVLNLVKEVTKDKQTKIFPIKSQQAWLIKFCDIIDNCTDMKSWDEKRMRKYLKKKRDFLGIA